MTAKRIKLVEGAEALAGAVAGTVYMFGMGDIGQLGIDAEKRKFKALVPQLPSGGKKVMEATSCSWVDEDDLKAIQVQCGGTHTVVLLKDGTVYTYGNNDDFALGRDAPDEEDMKELGKVELKSKIVQVTAGDRHSGALTTDGEVYLWGNFRDSNGFMGLIPEQNDTAKRREEQIQYGIYYDDDYDYLQHLKDSQEVSNIEWDICKRISAPRVKPEEGAGKDDSREIKLKLPSSVFQSEFEEDVGLLNKDAPIRGEFKEPYPWLWKDLPYDYAEGQFLHKIDAAISSFLKLGKILKNIEKLENPKKTCKKSKCWSLGWGILILMLMWSCVTSFSALKDENCESDANCFDCIFKGCVFVEFENKSQICVQNANMVRGIRRRQYSLNCPEDLQPKSVDEWLASKTQFLENKVYGYKVYVWLTIPILISFVIYVFYKLTRCYYHRTRLSPRSGWKVPECLRDDCVCSRRSRRERSPSMDMEDIHFESVSGSEGDAETTSRRRSSSLEPELRNSDLDETYAPSSINSSDTLTSPIAPSRFLRPRKLINYSED